MFFKIKVTKLFLLFFCLTSFRLLAQNDIYSFKQISYEQGLPGVNVRDIFQDTRGVMWIAVEAMGVCKYYGDKYIQYRNIPGDSLSLSSNFSNVIIEDPNENVWIATDHGLNRYKRSSGKFTRFFSTKDGKGLTNNAVHSLLIDSKGTMWVGTGNGLNKYNKDSNTFEHFLYKKDPSLSVVWQINTIKEDKKGHLWLGTNRGLLKFDPVSNTYRQWEKSSSTLIHNFINSIEICNDNIIWIGTHRGVNKFNLTTERFIPWAYKRRDSEELKDEGINNFFNDKNEQLWIGTYTKGVVKINLHNEEYERLTTSDAQQHGLKSNHIRSIIKDRSGTIWIATKFEGLFLQDFNKTIFSKWPQKYNLFVKLKDKYILDFYEDRKYDKVYWLASKFEGLYRVDISKNTIANYRHNTYKPTTISANRVHSVERDHFGDLYVGSENGLDLFVDQHKEFDHISSIPVEILKADKNKNLWIGTDEGVFILNRSEGRMERHRSAHAFFKSNIEITYIFEDMENNIWFSTDHNGLYVYNFRTDQLETYTQNLPGDKSISSDMARPVFQDSEKNIWIGTKTGGLVRIDAQTGKSLTFTTEHGLPTDFILGIEEDQQGNIWIATHNGLSRFDYEKSTFTNFNKEYGLYNNIFEIRVNHNFGDGCLLFGGNNGFNIFDTDSIDYKKSVPQLLLSSIKVLDKEVRRDVTQHQEIILSHEENYLTFEFGLTDYSNPVKHLFSYRLEGLDNGWSIPSTRNYASYSSLAPKEYTLRIKGANELGTWNDEGIMIKLVINPPFYATWTFRLSLVFSLLLIAYLAYRNKTNKNKKTKMLLESKIKERTQKLQNALKELKDQQVKIENQNEELSSQYEKIVFQRDHIQTINLELQLAHEELKVINDELDKRVKERTEKLMKTNQELDRFVYSASHDLSSPLKSILGLINIAKFENKDKSLANNLQYMERSVKKLEDVIKSLTQFSRNIGHEVKKNNIHFDELIEEILGESQVVYKTEGYEVKKDYNPGAVIYSDYLRLRIVLTNLISNAFKYKKPEDTKPRIDIAFLRDDDQYMITIKDNGIGISKENINKVFEMFFRATSQSEGSGLGLYIVAETLTKLGGKIELNSEPEQFTEFKLTLPLIQ